MQAAARPQQPDGVDRPATGGPHQRGELVFVDRIDRLATVPQQLHRRRSARALGTDDCRRAHAVGVVGAGAGVQQVVHQAGLASGHQQLRVQAGAASGPGLGLGLGLAWATGTAPAVTAINPIAEIRGHTLVERQADFLG